MITIKTQLQGHNIVSGIDGTESRVSDNNNQSTNPAVAVITADNIKGAIIKNGKVVGGILDQPVIINKYNYKSSVYFEQTITVVINSILGNEINDDIWNCVLDTFPASRDLLIDLKNISRLMPQNNIKYTAKQINFPFHLNYDSISMSQDVVFAPLDLFSKLSIAYNVDLEVDLESNYFKENIQHFTFVTHTFDIDGLNKLIDMNKSVNPYMMPFFCSQQ